jgi:hypothetical protein
MLLLAMAALLLTSAPRSAAALKATVHPGATECFDEHVAAEHFTVRRMRARAAGGRRGGG